jgi:pimeloyl-ACP methyl ester carboxylesterase
MSTIVQKDSPVLQEGGSSSWRPSRGQVVVGALLPILLLVGLVAAFGSPIWQLLSTATLVLALGVMALLAIGLLVVAGVIRASKHERTQSMVWLQRASRFAIAMATVLVVLGGVAVGSQLHAATPAITSANGQSVPGSIASMEQVTLNGSQQWITIRGKNTHNPVLLFLMGGPGAGGFPDQGFLAPLEDHFVIVNWDQPGTGKSYGAVTTKALTPERFVADAHALTLYLRARFHQDKIYVLGSSWGSILGILLVQQYPQLFAAYVGHGQMVNTSENDILGYEFALNYATQRKDTTTVDTLRRNGPPPYTGEQMIWKYAAFLNVLQDSMGLPSLTLGVPLLPQLAPEYGLVDRVNYVRGFFETFATLYPQLRDLDFAQSATKLDVPVYFLVGRADVNAMASLAERYYMVLQAPQKELIWFTSGHSFTDADTDQFVDVMVNHVLAQTRS